jgi:hypothetical protein
MHARLREADVDEACGIVMDGVKVTGLMKF